MVTNRQGRTWKATVTVAMPLGAGIHLGTILRTIPGTPAGMIPGTMATMAGTAVGMIPGTTITIGTIPIGMAIIPITIMVAEA